MKWLVIYTVLCLYPDGEITKKYTSTFTNYEDANKTYAISLVEDPHLSPRCSSTFIEILEQPEEPKEEDQEEETKKEEPDSHAAPEAEQTDDNIEQIYQYPKQGDVK